MKDEKIYREIVRKLGFEPKDYVFVQSHTENDQDESPFSVLTLEELRFLKKNDYFQKSV